MKRCEMERRGCMGRLQRRFVHQYVFCIKTLFLRVSVLGIAYFAMDWTKFALFWTFVLFR